MVLPRVCLFTFRPAAVYAGGGNSGAEGSYVTSYRDSAAEKAGNFYALWHDGTLRHRLCFKLLEWVDDHRWVPPAASLLALRFCGEELLELIRGCDPDEVWLDIRWSRWLQRAIRRAQPEWHCARGPRTEAAGAERRRQGWRRHDSASRVSIVLPTYNGGGQYLGESVESCLNQTHRNVELIIVDDGSTPAVAETLRVGGDPRVRFIRHSKNLGLPHALNTGFEAATGEYLTWTSDDNRYEPEAIETMLSFLQTYSEVDFVYAESYACGSMNGRPVGPIMKTRPVGWLRHDNGVGACFLYRREVYEKIGAYSPSAVLAEDYDYWIRVARECRMQRLFRPLYTYRFHDQSLTSKFSRDAIAAQARFVRDKNRVAG